MSVTPDDFLAEARALAAREDEMGVRLAINRAYYAAYHLALTVSHRCPAPAPGAQKGGSHWALLRRFEAAKQNKSFRGKSQASQIYFLLLQSRDFRHDADYDLSGSQSPQDARQVLRNAECIKELVSKFAALHAP